MTDAVAEHTMIETMARAIMEARDPEFGNGQGCRVIDWQAEARDNPHVAQAVAQARAALRSLIDAGPTQAMLDCVCSDMPGASIAARDDVVSDVFRSMLRAALEEAANG